MKSLFIFFIAVFLCVGGSCTPADLPEDSTQSILTGDEDSIRPDNDRD